jgi:hypothetical protein
MTHVAIFLSYYHSILWEQDSGPLEQVVQMVNGRIEVVVNAFQTVCA